jgi:hypothetical protein
MSGFNHVVYFRQQFFDPTMAEPRIGSEVAAESMETDGDRPGIRVRQRAGYP